MSGFVYTCTEYQREILQRLGIPEEMLVEPVVSTRTSWSYFALQRERLMDLDRLRFIEAYKPIQMRIMKKIAAEAMMPSRIRRLPRKKRRRQMRMWRMHFDFTFPKLQL